MNRRIVIPLVYLFVILALVEISMVAHSLVVGLVPYVLTLPWSLAVGLLFPDQWAALPIGIGAVINAGYLYGFLRP